MMPSSLAPDEPGSWIIVDEVYSTGAGDIANTEANVVWLQEVTRTPGLGGWTTFADGERTLP